MENKVEEFLDEMLSFIDTQANLDSIEDWALLRNTIKKMVFNLLNDK